MKCLYFLALAAMLPVFCGRASAQQPLPVLITVDEDGHGSICSPALGGCVPLTGVLAPDPGPGGLPSALTYGPVPGVFPLAGDVLLLSPNEGFLVPVVSDIVRFNTDPTGVGGTLVFYSDSESTFDSLADTDGPPGDLYANNIAIDEIGPEGLNGAVYTPGPTDPGFVPGFAVTYHLISDTPEPGSLAFLLGSGVIGSFFALRRLPRRQ